MTDLASIAARFARETARHEMEILHDDGLYRHLLFRETRWKRSTLFKLARKQTSSFYWFEIITAPNSLTFRGDGESFVFSRVTDMFEFFRGQRVNPSYWAEKLTSSRGAAEVYSEDRFREAVEDDLAASYPEGVPAALWDAVLADVLESDMEDVGYEDNARRVADGFEWYRREEDRWDADVRPDFQFYEVWEWRLKDYDWWLLWAMHAIVWGIGRYDQAKGQCRYDLAKALTPYPARRREPLKVLDPGEHPDDVDDRPTLDGIPVDTEFAAGGVL